MRKNGAYTRLHVCDSSVGGRLIEPPQGHGSRQSFTCSNNNWGNLTAQAKIYNQASEERNQIHIEQINCVCVRTAYMSSWRVHISICAGLWISYSVCVCVSFTVGVPGVLGVMALCSEACVSGSGGESSGSEVSFSFPRWWSGFKRVPWSTEDI